MKILASLESKLKDGGRADVFGWLSKYFRSFVYGYFV